MLTLYAVPASLYCAKTRILLRYKQAQWEELPPPGGYGSAEYRSIVTSGNLPALRHGDLLLADSEAIAEYLEEAFPDPAALPGNLVERAKTREFSRFHDTRLEPELRKLFAHIRPGGHDPEVSRRQGEAINSRLSQLAKLLDARPDAGKKLTLGDCGYPVSFAWMELLDPLLDLKLSWPDGVIAYRERVDTRPAVAAELAIYRDTLEKWLEERIRE